jgi:hypothetical protein
MERIDAAVYGLNFKVDKNGCLVLGN